MHELIFYRFLKLSSEKKLLLFEAIVTLLLARFALNCLPYKTLECFFNRLPKQPELQGNKRQLIRTSISWAIDRAARILPGSTVCFPRGIAAQAMLRRRNIGTRLYFGATSEDGNKLKSHVWVQDGTASVVGCSESKKYKVIACYPNIL